MRWVSSRAAIIVTGTEVLTGRVADRNSPWLAEQLRLLGVDIGQVIVVGDRRADLDAALAFLATSGLELIITTGGLGPTADDLTAEAVAAFQGRELELDEQLETRIAAIVERLSAGRGWTTDPVATAHAVRKQAYVPIGARVLEPVGTAPGLVVPPGDGCGGPVVVVLPGPPAELQQMWPAAVTDPLVVAAVPDREELRQGTVRLWGTPESELAAVLRGHGGDLSHLEITTCLRDGELEIVTRYHPGAERAYRELVSTIETSFAGSAFSLHGQTVDDIVAESLCSQGLTIATGESCTGGALADRLTRPSGASRFMLGGVVAYSNKSKADLLGVPTDLLDRHGAVSPEVAEAMAAGVRDRFGASVGVGITGVAGPGGGTEAKPVGLVQLCVASPATTLRRQVQVPGDRVDVRIRSVAVAMHMVRQAIARR
jgi:competence/damage-inducible protein CinA-like protein